MNYKIALVTGASSGIGKAIAESLAKHGVRLILIARRNDKLELLKRELQTNTKCHVIACDVVNKGKNISRDNKFTCGVSKN
jgi:3-hydroxy acid dehydrogenase / malonic semialdehyde reductase